jgi:tRNA A-37 threonylcarbamoyl transferase component Bud32
MLGTLLGSYRIVARVGEGGMGAVYVGHHETLGQRVAVKVLLPERSRDPDVVRRFFNEAQAATAIRNPGIAQVFDLGKTAGGQVYFVMELLEGQSLTQRLRQQRLDYAACCRIGRQIANVLQSAHEAGITHRDLKPDNLFLVPDEEVPGGERVKVLDFGIAKLTGEVGLVTCTGMVMGSPSYMSPEQWRSTRTADARSDIYALGCILFEMACGRRAFLGGNTMAIVDAHLHVPPPHPHGLAPDMPPRLSELIAKMLSKHPDARPQTMSAVRHALDEILQTLGGARASTAPPVPESAHAHAPPAVPVPVPRASSGAAPSGGAASGAATRRKVVARARAAVRPRWYTLGAIVVVCAIAGILVVVATQDQAATRAVSFASIQPPPAEGAEPPPAGGAAIGGAGGEVPGPEAEPPLTADELHAECRGYQVDRSWTELRQCASKLKSLDPERGAQLEDRAAREADAAERIAGVEAALRDRDLLRASAGLAEVWTESVGYAAIKRAYDAAEAQAIAALVARLEGAKTEDCKGYGALLAKARATKPPRVATEAARRAICQPRTQCNFTALADQGRRQYAAGQLAYALASFEAAFDCFPWNEYAEKAFVISCNLKRLPKARQLWKGMTLASRARAVGVCVRNQITRSMLDAPDGR